MGKSKKKISRVLYIISIVALAALWGYMHIYKIESVPAGLNIDEAGMAYDAFCILNWGVDRYLNPYPLYFYNLGGGMSAMYVYLCVFFIKLFGMHTFVFRIPAIIFSLITIVCTSLIIRKMYGNIWALINGFLFCVLPYFTLQSRYGLDCNIMLGAASLCFLATITAIEKDKKSYYVFAGILWGMALYTYVLSYIIFPVFLCMVFIHQLSKKNYKILLMLPGMMILAIPLIIMVIINVFELGTVKLGNFTIYQLQHNRATEFEFSIGSLVNNFLYNIKIMFTWDGYPVNAFPKYFTLYKISIPVCVIGFLYGVFSVVTKRYKNDKIKNINLYMLFYTLAMFVLCAIRHNCIYNLNSIYMALLFWIITGIYFIYEITCRIAKRSLAGKISVIAILFWYSVCFVDFSNYYFNVYDETLLYFTNRLDSVVGTFGDKISENASYKIYIDAYYLYYLIERRTDPYIAQIQPEGLDNFGSIVTVSVTSQLPMEIDENNIYVVNRNNYDYLNHISNYKFEEYWVENYIVFYNNK